eukprot:scaffold8063_cov27-Tisochrysis_lutea.AAC.2
MQVLREAVSGIVLPLIYHLSHAAGGRGGKGRGEQPTAPTATVRPSSLSSPQFSRRPSPSWFFFFTGFDSSALPFIGYCEGIRRKGTEDEKKARRGRGAGGWALSPLERGRARSPLPRRTRRFFLSLSLSLSAASLLSLLPPERPSLS